VCVVDGTCVYDECSRADGLLCGWLPSRSVSHTPIMGNTLSSLPSTVAAAEVPPECPMHKKSATADKLLSAAGAAATATAADGDARACVEHVHDDDDDDDDDDEDDDGDALMMM
jgi:hypothetical protein